MELHGNARLTPFQRELLCRRVDEEGWTAREAAEAAGCSERTAYTWLARWRAGEPMADRPSAPRTVAATPPETVEAVEALRRMRMTSTAIAARLGLPVSTVCAVLARIGLNRLSRLGPPEPPNRYCRRHAGELVHVDVKKLGRFPGPASASSARGPAATRAGRAGRRCTSASTTPPAWSTSRCWPTSGRRPRSRSSSGRWPGSPSAAWRSAR